MRVGDVVLVAVPVHERLAHDHPHPVGLCRGEGCIGGPGVHASIDAGGGGTGGGKLPEPEPLRVPSVEPSREPVPAEVPR